MIYQSTLFIHYSLLQKLSTGQLLLGAIREITDIDLVVSLPNQLTGYVSITEVSPLLSALLERAAQSDNDSTTDSNSDHLTEELDIPSLQSFFHIGQIVPVVIIELTSSTMNQNDKKTKKRIDLSMNPELVNKGVQRDNLCIGATLSCQVTSCEDHGLVLNSGLKETNFFMPTEPATITRSFIPGQLLQCIIIQVDSTKRNVKVALKADNHSVFEVITPMIDLIVPGLTVDCRIDSLTERGLIVTIGDLFEASISMLHTNHLPVSTYKVKQKVSIFYEFIDVFV